MQKDFPASVQGVWGISPACFSKGEKEGCLLESFTVVYGSNSGFPEKESTNLEEPVFFKLIGPCTI